MTAHERTPATTAATPADPAPDAPARSAVARSTREEETAREQRYVDRLHRRLDELREETRRRLAAVLREPAATAQARVERGVAVELCARLLAGYEAAEQGLCFGRLDLRDGARLHIGRIGLPAPSPGDDPLLLDWRASAARPFYTATAAAPQGVRRRRHIHTRGRRVVRLDDELLDRAARGGPDALAVTGEAALISALDAARTGRMRDIVATLQAEQDRIIRAPHSGVLVVQGGPGTGKTAVALHRAAYLLYTHPRLAERGVLVVGPNATFLSYIGQVLPGLGETNVLLATVGKLFPGVTATRAEPPAAAEVKGRAGMAEVLAAAVRDRQAAVTEPVPVEIADDVIRLDPGFCHRAAERARGSRLPHNRARPLFRQAVIAHLAARMAGLTRDLTDRIDEELAAVVDTEALDRAVATDLAGLFGEDAHGPAAAGRQDVLAEAEAEEAYWRRALPRDPAVRAVLDDLWPHLTPQRLLTELYADPARVASAAPGLSPAERALLHRPAGGGWSPADVPLLDEAAELLGHDDRAERARAAREHAEQVAYAQGILDIARASRAAEDDDGPERLTAADLLNAEQLAERHVPEDTRTVAERAAADRTWAFGHVIVDEAQELSAMAWRMLVRRCPGRSMTVVGDVAQTGEEAGTTSWADALAPHVGDRWRLERLTVNYRTPREVMAATDDVLAAIDPELEPPRAVRGTGEHPWRLATTGTALPARLADIAAAEAERLAADGDGGTLAVIVPAPRLAELGAAVRSRLPLASFGADPDLERPVVVLTARQAKGLEFDSVVIADPRGITDDSPRGLNDLYVALTRPTRSLAVVHPDPAPPLLARTVRPREP
ncbi:AAA family ATPase [Streptomyces capparidis]